MFKVNNKGYYQSLMEYRGVKIELHKIWAYMIFWRSEAATFLEFFLYAFPVKLPHPHLFI